MGKEATLKTVRSQLRNIVDDEMVAKVLTEKLVTAIRKELADKVDVGIKTLNKVLHERLEAIETRSKEIQSLLIRESGKGAAPTQQVPLISMEPDSK